MSRWKNSMQRKIKDAIMAVEVGSSMTVASITEAAGLGANTSPAYIALRELKRGGLLDVVKGKPFQGVADKYMVRSKIEQAAIDALMPAKKAKKMEVVTIDNSSVPTSQT